jgi:DMSO/TMAO reductase YedYZ molybdopterin-dependent catalytic subunit
MHNKNFFIGFLLLVVVLSLIYSAAVVTLGNTSKVIDLEGVEIREYEGRDLSSINDFRENSIKGPQYIDNETYRLAITGLMNNELEYTYDDIINNNQHFKKVVTLYCVEGWKTTILWEGVPVDDLIEETGVDPSATVVIFYAYDGYSSLLPLDYIIDNNIMITYKMNNVTLPPERGYPFQLVAESKYGYKWIKWITEIELSDNEKTIEDTGKAEATLMTQIYHERMLLSKIHFSR